MSMVQWMSGIAQSILGTIVLAAVVRFVRWARQVKKEGGSITQALVSSSRSFRSAPLRELITHLAAPAVVGAAVYLGAYGTHAALQQRRERALSPTSKVAIFEPTWQSLWNDAMADSNVALDLAGWTPSRLVRGIDFDGQFPNLLYQSQDGIGEERLVPDPEHPDDQAQWVQQWQREGITTACYDAETWDLRGKKIVVMTRVRTRGVMRKDGPTEESWMWGGKFLFQFGSGDTTYWEAANIIDPNADWHVRVLEQDNAKGKSRDDVPRRDRPQPHRYIIKVPEDAKDCQLHLGLRDAEGQIWFDDLGVFEVNETTGNGVR